MVGLVSAFMVVLVFGVAVLIALGVHGAALRAGVARDAARRLASKVLLGMGLLLGLHAVLARSGFLLDFDARPPHMFVVLFGSVAAFLAATSTPTFARLLHAMPRPWPIALQSMRVFVELGLWALASAGQLPIHLTFEGRNFDVFVGIAAPLVAIGLGRGWIGTRAAIAWNVASIGVLGNIVGMAITTLPGPLHLAWPGPSNTILGTFPFVWLPGFLVSVALFGHVISLRQLLATPLRSDAALGSVHDEESLGGHRG